MAVPAKKPAKTIPAAKLALYEKLIATDPSIERKGATIPYTSANGKMFTYLSPTGGLRLRLPPDERETLPGLLARTAELKKYLPISRAFAVQLGTKKTTRARPALTKRKRSD